MHHIPQVLIIQNEGILTWHIIQLIRSWGYQYHGWAANLKLSKAYLQYRNPDIVILDIHVKQKELNSHLFYELFLVWTKPFIILGPPSTIEFLFPASKFFYLEKPFVAQQLKLLLREASAHI